jgi:hypothetical protein
MPKPPSPCIPEISARVPSCLAYGTDLRSIEHDWRETRWHLAVQTNFDTGLNFVLGLDESIQKLVRVNDSLSIVRHQADEGCVPFVDNLRKRSRAGTHQDLTNAIVELLDA